MTSWVRESVDRLDLADRAVWCAMGGAEGAPALTRLLAGRQPDWKTMIRTAQANRTAVQLSGALRDVGDVPVSARAALLFVEAEIRRSVDSVRQRFERALPAIVERNQIILVRGMVDAYTSESGWPARPVGADVDLFIDEPHYLSISGRFLDHHHVPAAVLALEPPKLEYHLDPNFKSSWCVRLASIDRRELWARRQTLRIGPCEVGRLSAEDDLLYRAFHNVAKGFAGLYRFADLIPLMRSPGFDWEAVRDRALRWRIATPLWMNLSVVDSAVPDLVPMAILEQLEPGAKTRDAARRLFDPSLILHDPRYQARSVDRLRRLARKGALFRLLLLRPGTAWKMLAGPINLGVITLYAGISRAPVVGPVLARVRSAILRD